MMHVFKSIVGIDVPVISVITSGGNAGGQACVFPFVYRNLQYTECILTNNNGQLWCATTNSYDVDGLWANCVGTACTGTNTALPPATTPCPGEYHPQTLPTVPTPCPSEYHPQTLPTVPTPCPGEYHPKHYPLSPLHAWVSTTPNTANCPHSMPW